MSMGLQGRRTAESRHGDSVGALDRGDEAVGRGARDEAEESDSVLHLDGCGLLGYRERINRVK